MSTSTVPIGNPAGVNQANPALKNTSLIGGTTPSSTPIPGGSTPSATNPFMMGAGVPSGTAATGTVPSGSTPATSSQDDLLQKQLTDIYGKGVGGSEASMIAGMSGEQSAAFQQLQKSMAPEFNRENLNLTQTMGAAGVSPNSTVEALGLADLGAQQGATLAGEDARMIMQNQAQKGNMLGGMQQDAASEVASSGWDVFGQVIGDVGALAGDVMGMPGVGGSLGKMFGGAKSVGSSVGGVPAAQSSGMTF